MQENNQQQNESAQVENPQVESQVKEQQPQADQQEQQPAVPEFEDGDIITDGKDEIGIYRDQSDSFLHFHVKCDFSSGELNYVSVEAVASKKCGKWRKVTTLEAQFFAAAMSRLSKMIKHRD